MNCRNAAGLALLMVLAMACNKTSDADKTHPEGAKAPATEAEGAAKAEGADKAPEAPPGEAGSKADGAPAAPAVNAAVLGDPSTATEKAPDTFVVELTTTKGPIKLDVNRTWAPNGVDRFYNLVKAGYYTDVAFFRVIPGFMAQVGLHGDPAVNQTWRSANIDDDPVVQSNTRGMVTFATAGPNTRTTQFFINFADNTRLDGMGFAPFARIQPASMEIVDSLHGGYGEGAPRGKGPGQARIHADGNRYLKAEFPELDYIQKATVIEK